MQIRHEQTEQIPHKVKPVSTLGYLTQQPYEPQPADHRIPWLRLRLLKVLIVLLLLSPFAAYAGQQIWERWLDESLEEKVRKWRTDHEVSFSLCAGFRADGSEKEQEAVLQGYVEESQKEQIGKSLRSLGSDFRIQNELRELPSFHCRLLHLLERYRTQASQQDQGLQVTFLGKHDNQVNQLPNELTYHHDEEVRLRVKMVQPFFPDKDYNEYLFQRFFPGQDYKKDSTEPFQLPEREEIYIDSQEHTNLPKFQIEEPYGRELLTFIASSEPINISKKSINNPTSFLQDLERELEKQQSIFVTYRAVLTRR